MLLRVICKESKEKKKFIAIELDDNGKILYLNDFKFMFIKKALGMNFYEQVDCSKYEVNQVLASWNLEAIK